MRAAFGAGFLAALGADFFLAALRAVFRVAFLRAVFLRAVFLRAVFLRAVFLRDAPRRVFRFEAAFARTGFRLATFRFFAVFFRAAFFLLILDLLGWSPRARSARSPLRAHLRRAAGREVRLLETFQELRAPIVESLELAWRMA